MHRVVRRRRQFFTVDHTFPFGAFPFFILSRRSGILLAVALVLLLCFCNPPNNTPPPSEKPPALPNGLFFDDFNYSANADPALNKNGWTVRTGPGGPGPEGCIWDDDLVAFTDDTSTPDNRLLALSAWTEGSPASCHQAELFTPVRFKNGTFAARVLFSDRPDFGPDGDGVVQTFFTIAPWELAETDAYAEFDFEYLPNGGWGRDGAHLWQTSWETVNDKKSDQQQASFAGAWHLLTIQTDANETRYFINDLLVTRHAPPYLADGWMSINFNHWFIAASLDQGTRTKRQYTYHVDWVMALSDLYKTPAQVDSLVTELRTQHQYFYNSL